MPSDRPIRANRRNVKQATGPGNIAGKARSSPNAAGKVLCSAHRRRLGLRILQPARTRNGRRTGPFCDKGRGRRGQPDFCGGLAPVSPQDLPNV